MQCVSDYVNILMPWTLNKELHWAGRNDNRQSPSVSSRIRDPKIMVDRMLEPSFFETPVINIVDPSSCPVMNNGMKCVIWRNFISNAPGMKDIIRVIPHRNMFPKSVASHLRPNVKKLVGNWRCNGNLGSTPVLGLPLRVPGMTTMLVGASATQSKTNDQVEL